MQRIVGCGRAEPAAVAIEDRDADAERAEIDPGDDSYDGPPACRSDQRNRRTLR